MHNIRSILRAAGLHGAAPASAALRPPQPPQPPQPPRAPHAPDSLAGRRVSTAAAPVMAAPDCGAMTDDELDELSRAAAAELERRRAAAADPDDDDTEPPEEPDMSAANVTPPAAAAAASGAAALAPSSDAVRDAFAAFGDRLAKMEASLSAAGQEAAAAKAEAVAAKAEADRAKAHLASLAPSLVTAKALAGVEGGKVGASFQDSVSRFYAAERARSPEDPERVVMGRAYAKAIASDPKLAAEYDRAMAAKPGA